MATVSSVVGLTEMMLTALVVKTTTWLMLPGYQEKIQYTIAS